jgi:Na+/H+ antiporter NhaD/arsenite permease-like protein
MNALAEHRPLILAIFVLTYMGMAAGRVPGLQLSRTGIALLGAIAMMVFSGRSAAQAAASVNWPTILLLFGFFVISAQLRLSGFYTWIAEWISRRVDAPTVFLAFMTAVTAGLSAFLNHDIVCYVLTPVAAAALIKKGRNPVPYLVSLAIASNIGAAGTLIGSPQNILIGEVAGLSFLHHMLWSVPPVLFGLAAICMIVPRMADGNAPVGTQASAPPPDVYPINRYHMTKGLVILAAVIALFFTSLPKEIVVLAAAGIHLASAKFRTEDILTLVDWPILVLFTCLFVVSGTFQATGYGEQAVDWLRGVGFNPTQPAYLTALTAGLSVLITNAPAVMLLLKIVPMAKATTGYVMIAANSFGGSLILSASVSNIIVVQQAREQGIFISFRDFARIGIPVTLIALAGLVGWAELMGT